ncbi:Wzt carbohydrate-binding domain-containing protein, partial [Pseudomonas sp. SIMBA_065]
KAVVKEESHIQERFVKINKFVKDVKILNDSNEPVNCMEVGKNYSFEISCSGLSEYSDPHVGFRMQDRLGQVLYETNTYCQKSDL